MSEEGAQGVWRVWDSPSIEISELELGDGEGGTSCMIIDKYVLREKTELTSWREKDREESLMAAGS